MLSRKSYRSDFKFILASYYGTLYRSTSSMKFRFRTTLRPVSVAGGIMWQRDRVAGLAPVQDGHYRLSLGSVVTRWLVIGPFKYEFDRLN
jgi:hypothetical protein